MKHVIKLLTAITILSLSIGLCGCFRNLDQHSTREDLEPQVISYVQEKYGFKPEIEDWQTRKGLYNYWYNDVLLNDGHNQFMVQVDPNDKITDNYESGAIDEDIRKWADSIFPGAVRSHADHNFFAKDQKYTGDVWSFFEENKVHASLSFTYVNKPLDNKEAKDFMNEIAKIGHAIDYVIMSCPSEEAAKIVGNKSYPNGISEIIKYTPYVNESLSYTHPSDKILYQRYDGRKIGNCLYIENFVYSNEPVPEDEYYIEQADGSLSDICSTYVAYSNHSESGDSKNTLSVWVFIPLSEIDETPVFNDDFSSEVTITENMKCIDSSSLDGELSKSNVSVYGEYAVICLNLKPGTTYFSIKGNK